MKKPPVFKLIFIILFLLTLYSYAFPQGSLAPLVKKIQPAVVTVITYDALGEQLSIGSGFFINKEGLLITNHHVVGGASKILVQTPDRNKFKVSDSVAEDRSADLVVLAVDIPKTEIKYLKISSMSSEVGDRVMVIGSPLGLEQTISDGVISAVRNATGFGEILQISAPISRGSSGGPVVNMKGEVIGVATFQIIGGQNLNFAIPGFRVLALKNRAEQYFSKVDSGSKPKGADESGKIDVEGLQRTHRLSKQYYTKGSAALAQAKFAEQARLYRNAEEKYKEAISFFERAILIEPYSEARLDIHKAKSGLEAVRKRGYSSPEAWKDDLRKNLEPYTIIYPK